MSIYDIYEEQKVPHNHRVKKITPDYFEYLNYVTNINKSEKILTVNFSVNGACYLLSICFPTIGGIRIYGNKKGYFDSLCNSILFSNTVDGIAAICENGYSVLVKTNSPTEINLNYNGKIFYTLDKKTLSFGFKEGKSQKFSFKGYIKSDEKIFGLGEKYNSINQVGYELPLFNDDTGYHFHPEDGDKTRSYKNVPLFHSSQGYTVFFNSFYPAVADFSLENSTKFNIEFNSPMLDIFFWCGNPIENLNNYTLLTGRPILPPKWSFGFWAGGCGYNWEKYGKEIVNVRKCIKEVVKGYEALNIFPAAFYGENYPSYDKKCYELISEIGSQMLGWNHPGVDLSMKGYDVKQIRNIFPGISDDEIPMFHDPITNQIIDEQLFYIDYSHPKSVELIIDKYKKYWNWGLRGVMVDFGEYVYEDILAYNGMLGDEMHNFYSYCYSKTIHDAWETFLHGDYILFARAACAGTQRWVSFFGGDQNGEFYGLRQAYYGGLNASSVGFTIWGSDIGSLNECKTKELYLRWLQFATFSPLMRTHGNHNPWNYGEDCTEIFKKYFWLRENIKEYIYSAAINSHLTGKPLMNTMAAYYPEQANLKNEDDQYMFGDNLLVCPILYEGMIERRVMFPKGIWYDLWDGSTYKGGKEYIVSAPVEKCPVYIRQGSVIPIDTAEDETIFTPINNVCKKALLLTLQYGDNTHYQEKDKIYRFKISLINDVEYVFVNFDGYDADSLIIYSNVSRVIANGKDIPLIKHNNFSVARLENIESKEFRIIC